MLHNGFIKVYPFVCLFTLVKGVCRLLGGVLSLLGRLLRPLVGTPPARAGLVAALPRGFLRLESGVDKTSESDRSGPAVAGRRRGRRVLRLRMSALVRRNKPSYV